VAPDLAPTSLLSTLPARPRSDRGSDLDVSVAGHGRRITLTQGSASARAEVYFASDRVALHGAPESALIASLLPAMRQGARLSSSQPVSPRLLASMRPLQDILTTWDRTLQRVPVDAPALEHIRDRSPRVGTFFSGGVDSLYTLLKHQDEITDLVFIHGFDIKRQDTVLYALALENIQRLADTLGKRVLTIETDLREHLDRYADWASLTHGAALASVGHLLSQQIGRLYVPSTHTYADLFPWGSHPVLDGLWSSEALEFVHDGSEARRVDKAALLATSDAALQALRVCFKNTDGAYNCGRCEKCLRTQVNLLAAGALDRCPTFSAPLDLELVRATKVRGANARSFVEENLDVLQARGIAPDVQEALRASLNPQEAPPLVAVRDGVLQVRMPQVLRRAARMARTLLSR
jgi:hypothetical protein